jgi:uncharacterized protein
VAGRRERLINAAVTIELLRTNQHVDPEAAVTAEPSIHIPQDEIADFCRRHRIRKLSLFGSVIRDDFTDESDIDVLVEFEEGHTPGIRFFDLDYELSEILGRKVEVHTRGFLSPYFRDEVIAEAVTQYDESR